MMATTDSYPFRELRLLPGSSLRLRGRCVSIPASYRATWPDGFGARGWKLDANLDDPEIIAATSDASGTIPTSVLVHDALDHLLCGFAPSGHRAEAMALEQLARRTGSDPTPDYRQMAREDLLTGQVVGEPLYRFIGAELRHQLPTTAADWDDRSVVNALRERLGDEALVEQLVQRMAGLGHAGRPHALLSWRVTGFAYARRTELGLRLQRLLEQMDAWVDAEGLTETAGEIRIGQGGCAFVADQGPRLEV
ncbi:hypothetical protein [Halochromatium salexigens]|uniref:Uncharacterized protein n=1 Tax=Halochromatium salexigens TaxID=49447 RepID=A0AAJ0XEI1_HALSE|nr:hypothetical protein [Halochromatium salexigens]MBK5929356.1 hypothetical protein [Halochromatium salexigens]